MVRAILKTNQITKGQQQTNKHLCVKNLAPSPFLLSRLPLYCCPPAAHLLPASLPTCCPRSSLLLPICCPFLTVLCCPSFRPSCRSSFVKLWRWRRRRDTRKKKKKKKKKEGQEQEEEKKSSLMRQGAEQGGVSFFGCSCNFPGSLKKKLCYWEFAVEDRILFGVSLADKKLLMKMMNTETKKSPALRSSSSSSSMRVRI